MFWIGLFFPTHNIIFPFQWLVFHIQVFSNAYSITLNNSAVVLQKELVMLIMQGMIWAGFLPMTFKRLQILEENIVQGLIISVGTHFKTQK